jgi:hypothetical protein
MACFAVTFHRLTIDVFISIFIDEKILSSYAWAIPFNVPPPPPLWTRSIKFEPLRKKDQSADTNTPSEIKKFLPYPSEK